MNKNTAKNINVITQQKNIKGTNKYFFWVKYCLYIQSDLYIYKLQ